MQEKPAIPKAFEQPSMFDGFDTEPTEKLTCWTPCSPREVFKSEAQLEETLLRDPSALAIISGQVGMEFARIARQVRTGRSLAQRADLVAIGSSPALPVIVIELMLPALNGEHVTRPIGYAVSLQAKDIVLIAESFPQPTLNLLGVMRTVTDKLGITVHLMKLEAFRNLNGASAYSLRPLTPPKTPEHRQTFLESLILRVARQGDDSLLNCNVSEGKRLDSYQGLGNLARIRIYSGHGNARISIISLSSRLRQRLLRKRVPEHLKQHLAPFEPTLWSKGGKSIVTSVGFEIDTSTAASADESLTRIANAYIALREYLMASIGDFTRAPTTRAASVQFRRADSLGSGLAETLRAIA